MIVCSMNRFNCCNFPQNDNLSRAIIPCQGLKLRKRLNFHLKFYFIVSHISIAKNTHTHSLHQESGGFQIQPFKNLQGLYKLLRSRKQLPFKDEFGFGVNIEYTEKDIEKDIEYC